VQSFSIKREILIVINQEMRNLIKSILLEVGIEDLKIRSRGDNHCESAKLLEHVAETISYS